MNARLSTSVDVLVVRGQVDVKTIWPEGVSDADTLRVRVDPSTEWAWFRTNGVFRQVRGLERAVVHGAVVRPVLSTTSSLSIRLQGIDAPELHYRAPLPARTEPHDEEPRHSPTYRQPFGETASAALQNYLATFGAVIDVEVWTAVRSVEDAFDTYGRFVGDVYVCLGDRRLSVNQWLVEKGLVVPTFYTSMRAEEIEAICILAARARKAGRGLWSRYSTDAQPADPRRLYRGKRAQVREERGRVYLPKLFRRRIAWRESGLSVGQQPSFRAYLESRGDRVMLSREFIAARRGGSAATSLALVDVMSGSELDVDPSELVFEERPAELRFPSLTATRCSSR